MGDVWGGEIVEVGIGYYRDMVTQLPGMLVTGSDTGKLKKKVCKKEK